MSELIQAFDEVTYPGASLELRAYEYHILAAAIAANRQPKSMALVAKRFNM
jgi:hypothetical protein